jgi:hypothetical protein
LLLMHFLFVSHTSLLCYTCIPFLLLIVDAGTSYDTGDNSGKMKF